MNDVVAITVQRGDRPLTFKGRQAWALHLLIERGAYGVTPLEQPALRWSSYIHRLRRGGLSIDTIPERHGGSFSGEHARYRLAETVEVVSVQRQQDRARVAA